MKRKIVSIFLIGILLITMVMPTIFAKTAAEQKKEDLENQLNEAKDQKEDVTNQKNTILDEISELDSKISKYESEIENLNAKINNLKKSITSKEVEIKKLEKEYKEKEEAFVERMVALYEAGETSYLDILLSSDSVVNFISNYYMISELAEADKSMRDQIQAQQEKIEKTKKELEEQKADIAKSRNSVEAKKQSLDSAKSSKQSKVSSLSAKEKELQSQIDKFNAGIKEAQKQIQKELEEANKKNDKYVGSFEGDLSWPLSSSSYGYNFITSVFGYRDQPVAGASTNHGAVDIAVRYQPVYAPASGKIIIARCLPGYGEYILIDHGNGYYTGFGHLSGYSVSKGDVVSRGQKIATSGDTGISSGPHLHYEVHIGGYAQSDRVDPLKYTSHPSLIYY